MINWEDTVMNKGKMVEGGHVELLLEQQAETTWDIAKQAGIDEAIKKYCQYSEDSLKLGRREVVEWFMANQFDREHWENGSGYCSEGCPACRLDKQLKDWGVEK